MKKVMLIFGSFLAATVITACGKSDGGGNNNVVTCNTTVINGVCQNGGVIPSTATTGTYGVLQLVIGTNTGDGLRAFLRNGMGVCDIATWSAGDAKCDNWLNGKWDIRFAVTPGSTSGIITLRVYPNLSGWSLNAGIYSPMGATCGVIYNYQYCEISFNTTVSMINNSQGLEYRTYGALNMPSNRSLLQLQAVDILTNRQDGTFSARIFFPSNGVYQQILSAGNIGRRQ